MIIRLTPLAGRNLAAAHYNRGGSLPTMDSYTEQWIECLPQSMTQEYVDELTARGWDVSPIPAEAIIP